MRSDLLGHIVHRDVVLHAVQSHQKGDIVSVSQCESV